MPTCPSGHESASTDFCDVCGMRLGAPATPAPAAGTDNGTASRAAPTATPAPPAEPCPQCGAGRSGQFCESCGYNFAAGRPATVPALAAGPAAVATGGITLAELPGGSDAPAGDDVPATADGVPAAAVGVPAPDTAPAPTGEATIWTAVVTADRAYFDRVMAEGGPDAATMDFPEYCPERRFRLSGPQMRIGRRSISRGLEPEIDLTGPPADPGVSHLHAVLLKQPDGGWEILDPGSSNGTMVNDTEIAAGTRVPLHDGDRVSLGGWTVLTIAAR
jgi:hypothetical protein